MAQSFIGRNEDVLEWVGGNKFVTCECSKYIEFLHFEILLNGLFTMVLWYWGLDPEPHTL